MIYLKQVNLHSHGFPTQNFYPFSLEIFQNTASVQFNRAITLFVGENGTGKSTLLRALAIRCGIHIWQEEFNLRVNENPHENDLYKHISVEWDQSPVPGSFFGSQIFTHFARNLEEWAINDRHMFHYFGGKSLVTQSHGQSLMSYFKSRYTLKGLYFLDEPETALSPSSLIDLLNLLIRINQQGHAQFIIATHSPFLLACPDAEIFTFDRTTIEPIAYKETQYYQIYKNFMNNPDGFMDTGSGESA